MAGVLCQINLRPLSGPQKRIQRYLPVTVLQRRFRHPPLTAGMTTREVRAKLGAVRAGAG